MLPKAMKAWRAVRTMDDGRPMSQADLAELANKIEGASVSEGLIAQIETGRRQPGYTNAIAIAAALGVDLEAIAFVHLPGIGADSVDVA